MTFAVRCFPLGSLCVALLACGSASVASAQSTPAAALGQVGRAPTPAEIRAWDIDVRGDFEGLPKGAGSVSLGEKVWEAKCASCHGAFGESNEVFTPIVGGTSKKDIEAGRVYYLANPGYTHRTTLMRASRLSTLWDYIHRAMPWNAPKSLATDEVYAVLAYMLNLGDIVPADFTLSDRNIAEVQNRLPNRNGKVFYTQMWETHGKGDVTNPPCMHDCPVEGKIASALPDAARNANGNIAEQVRPFGPARGTDTSVAPAGARVGVASKPVAAGIGPNVEAAGMGSNVAAVGIGPNVAAAASQASGADVARLLQANACSACHATTNKIVGPAFRDVAKKYAGRADAAQYLAAKIRQGGQGVWGSMPMPGQPQLKEADAQAIAAWLADGAK